ncbi:MAG: YbaB/EbfC family nucleoid-associated protein [Defluviitaleaceae bacterium]|nr:YbaB/EbfC family nucleoid-associated protein [Defluviitaleaceae bacterium]MCL2263404.1 YbaB/EbfC family nucleoid-associated protein [Defluviitaleaceae bacterium]
MPKGFGGGMPGGMNMNNLMKQAQKMQKQMAEMQEALAEKTLEVSSGGGAVKVKVNGEKQILDLIISPDAVDPDDIEMLQDLVRTAVNEALRQMEDAVNSQMSQITGGMNLPGMF